MPLPAANHTVQKGDDDLPATRGAGDAFPSDAWDCREAGPLHLQDQPERALVLIRLKCRRTWRSMSCEVVELTARVVVSGLVWFHCVRVVVIECERMLSRVDMSHALPSQLVSILFTKKTLNSSPWPMAGASTHAMRPMRAARSHPRAPPHTATAAKLGQIPAHPTSDGNDLRTVSYTHLTLPTILRV